jgi:hypothetical protein
MAPTSSACSSSKGPSTAAREAVLETIAEFDGKDAIWTAKVVPGSGTDAWASTRGEGHFRAPHGPRRRSVLTAASTEGRWGAERRARRAANLLGALTLALSDRLEGATTAAASLAENDAVALSALHQFLESPRVDLLAPRCWAS